ncbi:GntR family transcriptional regulator [Puteibacter caeruleilacunae]|nr:GntR family transcriptional regulator [Puteibacter caeruleilacunae]
MDKNFHDLIIINKDNDSPIYQQIVDSIMEGIMQGRLKENDQLPSVNFILREYGIARQTLIKALRLLQEKGIVKAVHGKGYFITNASTAVGYRVFVLFDTFASYKEVLYSAIKDRFGESAELDIYFHHYNDDLFQKLVSTALGNYTHYLILPYTFSGINDALKVLPKKKVYLFDIEPDNLTLQYQGVFQDFYKDVLSALVTVKKDIQKYDSILLVNRYNISMVPKGILNAFNDFIATNQINGSIIDSLKGRQVAKGQGYIVFDDEDLVYLIEECNKLNLSIGHDVGIISYNDTPLKKVVADGISVISTDFIKLGEDIVDMIIKREKVRKYNPSKIIRRGSF